MTQPSLLDLSPVPTFHGPDLTVEDRQRLSRQLDRVAAVMADGAWRTLAELHEAIGGAGGQRVGAVAGSASGGGGGGAAPADGRPVGIPARARGGIGS